MIPFTAVGTASAVLALSKAAWKLGISLSKLDQDARNVDTTVKNLAGEVKSLGIECDLGYAELEEVVGRRETRSPPPYDVDNRLWVCLAAQVEESSQTMQELELFVKRVRGEESNFTSQAQRQMRLDNSKDQIASVRTKICRHTDNLRTTLLLINTLFEHVTPCRAGGRLSKELEKLQDMVEKLQRSWEANPQARPSHTEVTLIQCAREVIVNGTTKYEASLAAESVAGGRGAVNRTIRVAEWVSTLESIRRDQRRSDPSGMFPKVPSVFSGEEAHTDVKSTTSAQRTMDEHGAVDAVVDNSDDDLDTDLAKAALDTGKQAFEAQKWEEADCLLQEALRVLQQLPKKQRAFCDIFDLHFKLAVCANHTQEPADAQEALVSLVQQSASADEQCTCIHDARHLLSQSYIRIGQVDRARSEYEKALQARRRLLGKGSDASLESTALMAHIYVLLDNRARAKSCLAMIPEARRDTILRTVEESLGTSVEHLEFSSLLTRSTSGDSVITVEHIQSRLSASTLGSPMGNNSYDPVSVMLKSPAASPLQSHQRIPSNRLAFEERFHDSTTTLNRGSIPESCVATSRISQGERTSYTSPSLQSVTVTSLSSAEGISEARVTERERLNTDYSADSVGPGAATWSPGEPPEAMETLKSQTLSRKEILDKIGCQPRDQIEDAVCDGDHSALSSLLNRKKDFWRSKLRKRVRPERVTALHFAALFGEIDMARRLLGSSFSINEVPYGYTTSLTPLKFAIGARQVDMVEFLIEHGAKPSEPDSWSTLAQQLMSRSWLMKTMSEAEKEFVPNRIVAIMRILLQHGWDVNEPFETSGATVLHQAVTFWTGSYRWDLNLRFAITSFLCERGADPFQANADGKTPYDMASASGDHDLVLLLDRESNKRGADGRLVELVELSC